VGILGYGSIGRYLVQQILFEERVSHRFELAFVWNRSIIKIQNEKDLPQTVILENLEDYRRFNPDIVVEVAHPSITKQYGANFVQFCDYLVGSPTAFADQEVENRIREAAIQSKGHGVYIARGALWGVFDIEAMAQSGNLFGLSVTMKFHPSSLKLVGSLKEKLDSVKDLEGEQLLYEGPVRPLCELAPRNINTIACAALAGSNLGFDKTQARLISDKGAHAHIIEITVLGPDKGDFGQFKVTTQRINPALPGAVTGTVNSFLSSLMTVGGRGSGIHFC